MGKSFRPDNSAKTDSADKKALLLFIAIIFIGLPLLIMTGDLAQETGRSFEFSAVILLAIVMPLVSVSFMRVNNLAKYHNYNKMQSLYIYATRVQVLMIGTIAVAYLLIRRYESLQALGFIVWATLFHIALLIISVSILVYAGLIKKQTVSTNRFAEGIITYGSPISREDYTLKPTLHQLLGKLTLIAVLAGLLIVFKVAG